MESAILKILKLVWQIFVCDKSAMYAEVNEVYYVWRDGSGKPLTMSIVEQFFRLNMPGAVIFLNVCLFGMMSITVDCKEPGRSLVFFCHCEGN